MYSIILSNGLLRKNPYYKSCNSSTTKKVIDKKASLKN